MPHKPFLVELGHAIRESVLPHLGQEESRRNEGVAHSGDTTFTADVAAEETLLQFLEASGRSCQYYSEDAGLVTVGGSAPEFLLVVDPIDGTRPAICGFEACVVSIALIPGGQPPVMGEVTEGLVMEIPTGRLFYADGTGAVAMDLDDTVVPLRPTRQTEINRMFFAYELAGNPAPEMARILEPFFRGSSLTGGAFQFNSSAYDLTRIARGQLDAFIAVGARLLRECPELESRFLDAGNGAIVGLFPYDIAAAAFIARTAGATVTDASGGPLDGYDCLAKGKAGFLSCVAASTPELHRGVIAAFDGHFHG